MRRNPFFAPPALQYSAYSHRRNSGRRRLSDLELRNLATAEAESARRAAMRSAQGYPVEHYPDPLRDTPLVDPRAADYDPWEDPEGFDPWDDELSGRQSWTPNPFFAPPALQYSAYSHRRNPARPYPGHAAYTPPGHAFYDTATGNIAWRNPEPDGRELQRKIDAEIAAEIDDLHHDDLVTDSYLRHGPFELWSTADLECVDCGGIMGCRRGCTWFKGLSKKKKKLMRERWTGLRRLTGHERTPDDERMGQNPYYSDAWVAAHARQHRGGGKNPRKKRRKNPPSSGYIVFSGKTSAGNKSHKFWYGSVRGKILYRAWGAIDGKRFRQELVQYSSRADALADLARTLATKKRKGYRGAALPGFLKQAEREFR